MENRITTKNNKIIVKFFSSFCDSLICKNNYLNQCKGFLLDNEKTIELTTDDTYTHAIILNVAMPKLTIPKENVIGLALEPNFFLGLSHTFIHYAAQFIGKYFIGNANNLPPPFYSHYGYLWYMPPPRKSLYVDKPKIMSIIISKKIMAPGHKYRHLIVQEILKRNLPIDIYGRGCFAYKEDPRIKGPFTEEMVYLPYLNYKYHICIENFSLDHYFSEKITNALLAHTIPIYFGCRKINEYFPDMVINLNSDLKNDMKIIEGVLNSNPPIEKRRDQEYVLEKVSLFNKLTEEWICPKSS